MRYLLIPLFAVVGLAGPAQAAPIELVDPQDPANYVPVTLVATPLDALKITAPLPGSMPPYELLFAATPPETTFWLNRSNLRFQPQLRGWFFDRTTWTTPTLDLGPEGAADAITLTVSTEPFNGDLEVPLGRVDRIWTIDAGVPRTVVLRAFITPEPSTVTLTVLAIMAMHFRNRSSARA